MKELTTDQRQIDFSAMKMFAGTKETQEDVFKAFTDMLVTLRKQKLTQLGMIVTLTMLDQVREDLERDFEDNYQ